jgi:hypothetical protein
MGNSFPRFIGHLRVIFQCVCRFPLESSDGEQRWDAGQRLARSDTKALHNEPGTDTSHVTCGLLVRCQLRNPFSYDQLDFPTTELLPKVNLGSLRRTEGFP